MSTVVKLVEPARSSDVPLQETSIDTWDSKYHLKTKAGEPVDGSVEGMFDRVATDLADVEDPKVRDHWKSRFEWALANGAVPAGRILSNCGALEYKPATSTINCTVAGTVPDSMTGIMSSVHEAALTLKAGCGIGYEFSTLRPKGAYVAGAGATTSGPLSFMDIYDKMCFTVSSAGGRRGAQMGTMDVGHPDIMDFIKAKKEDGRLRQFNLSILVRDEFIQAVMDDAEWALAFPAMPAEMDDESMEIVYRDFPGNDDRYTVDEAGRKACRVYSRIKARNLWNVIMTSTFDRAEPGFILIDAVNRLNNNWFCEDIRATNPCGEQPLPPYGACLLGSVNLTKYVLDPFTENARFDWDTFREVVSVFTRMLDNVVEKNGLPLEKQREEITRKRRHGMGYLGLGSMMTMLRIPYGSPESVEITEAISRELAVAGWKAGLELAKEKGAAPIMNEEFEVTTEMLAKRPQMAEDGIKAGDRVAGKVLHAKYSNYMQRIAEVEPELVEELAEVGARFTHHSSIAPTGTISLSMGNNASNGIEPTFSHYYFRNVIRPGRKAKEKVDVYSFEYLAYKHFIDSDAEPDSLPDYFVSADDVTPAQHVAIQAASQQWIDSAISKTVNVPTDIAFEAFQDVYMDAAQKGLKGCTTFRFNPEVFQGVLVKEEDVANTTYEFTLKSGETVTYKGTDMIEYEGETHTAANLFDALKEGYYGKL